jgi:hypothetical protein
MVRRMNRLILSALVALIFSLPLCAQHGTAPNGYYPQTYMGAIFTGTLDSVAPDTQEITLLYTKGSKSEVFTGRLESACGWAEKSGATHSFRASDIPKGTVLTVFYRSVEKKSNGQKTKENSIFAISYVELKGEKIPENKRVRVSCSDEKPAYFKAFQ